MAGSDRRLCGGAGTISWQLQVGLDREMIARVHAIQTEGVDLRVLHPHPGAGQDPVDPEVRLLGLGEEGERGPRGAELLLGRQPGVLQPELLDQQDRKSTRLNSSYVAI